MCDTPSLDEKTLQAWSATAMLEVEIGAVPVREPILGLPQKGTTCHPLARSE
jgi:hypothetical protein